MHSTAFSTSRLPVTTTTEVPGWSSRIRARSSSPGMPGMVRSRRTRPTSREARISMASMGSAAVAMFGDARGLEGRRDALAHVVLVVDDEDAEAGRGGAVHASSRSRRSPRPEG